MRQHLLGTLALCDVAVNHYESLGLAFCSANDAGRGLKNPPRAIFVEDAIFQALAATSDAGFLSGSAYASAVVWVDLFQGRARQLVLAIPENFLVCRAVIKRFPFLSTTAIMSAAFSLMS